MNEDKLNLSDEEKVSIFDALCRAPQRRIYGILQELAGFVWSRGRPYKQGAAELSAKILDALANGPMSRAELQDRVGSANIAARLAHLRKRGSIVLCGTTGLFKLKGDIDDPAG